MRGVWKNVLFDIGHAVLSPAIEELLSTLSSGSELRASAFPLVHRWQVAANVDFRGDRSLVSSLAIDGRRATKLTKHTCPRARRGRPDGLRAAPLDRHRRIRFLREDCQSRLWSSGSLCAGPEDAEQRSHRESRTTSADGSSWRFEEVLNNSEDSSTPNTSFIERLNLTIRQRSAYLARRTLSHARSKGKLEEQLEILRCYDNFVRPHRVLKFGRETRTPAMQTGLVTRQMTFREVFVCPRASLLIED